MYACGIRKNRFVQSWGVATVGRTVKLRKGEKVREEGRDNGDDLRRWFAVPLLARPQYARRLLKTEEGQGLTGAATERVASQRRKTARVRRAQVKSKQTDNRKAGILCKRYLLCIQRASIRPGDKVRKIPCQSKRTEVQCTHFQRHLTQFHKGHRKGRCGWRAIIQCGE
jgi:hypothetical protein